MLPRGRRTFWRRFGCALLALASLAIAVLVALAAAIAVYGEIDHARSADVIVVLGGGESGTTRRTLHAAALYAEGLAPTILCTGGYALPDGQTEAGLCAVIAREQGVPAAAIQAEPHSLTTAQNARRTADLMRAQGWGSAVVVSDNFHLLRARWLFAREGVTVSTSPAQRTAGRLNAGDWLYKVARETAAITYTVIEAALGR